jgi:hypothetical protein
MASPKQIEANRRNALKSTGPRTAEGKIRSRRNAVRHGLTAETVIVGLEDVEDYKAFEASVTADYEPQTTVERELVLRLASLLWRLRRTTAIETGLLKLGGGDLNDAVSNETGLLEQSNGRVDGYSLFKVIPEQLDHGHGPDIARRFLHLAKSDDGAFERLSRYETALWRQVGQTLFLLSALGARTWYGSRRMRGLRHDHASLSFGFGVHERRET